MVWWSEVTVKKSHFWCSLLLQSLSRQLRWSPEEQPGEEKGRGRHSNGLWRSDCRQALLVYPTSVPPSPFLTIILLLVVTSFRGHSPAPRDEIALSQWFSQSMSIRITWSASLNIKWWVPLAPSPSSFFHNSECLAEAWVSVPVTSLQVMLSLLLPCDWDRYWASITVPASERDKSANTLEVSFPLKKGPGLLKRHVL